MPQKPFVNERYKPLMSKYDTFLMLYNAGIIKSNTLEPATEAQVSAYNQAISLHQPAPDDVVAIGGFLYKIPENISEIAQTDLLAVIACKLSQMQTALYQMKKDLNFIKTVLLVTIALIGFFVLGAIGDAFFK